MLKKIPQVEYFFLALLFTINLLVGAALASDYGESWDEFLSYQYGNQSLKSYRVLFDPNIKVDFGDNVLRFYGPAYLMGMSLLVQSAHRFLPQISAVDLWHIGNFICLQFGLLCFYFLARRFLSGMAAFGATALFALQPLVWGHGFINPKDIPFMAFFTASVFFGLRMLDDLERQNFVLKTLLGKLSFYKALDFFYKWLKPLWIQILVFVMILFPGIWGMLSYHPYEYTYYNTAATLSVPIFRNFETDYWATSFKEVSSYLNDHAPQNARVLVWGPSQLVQRYIRNDIQVKGLDEVQDVSFLDHPFYLVITTRYDLDLNYYPEIQPLYSVQKNGSVLAVVKYITPGK